MSLYLMTVILSFIVINGAELYRIRRMRFKDLVVNTTASVLPIFNVLVALFCIHIAVNDDGT